MSNLNRFNLRELFIKVYAVTIFGVGFSFLSGYFLQNIWIHLMQINGYAFLAGLIIVSVARSFIKVDNLLPFCVAKVIDGLFFSIVFFVINTVKIANMFDLYLSCGITIVLFVVSALSSMFITKESYRPVLFTTQIIIRTYTLLCAVDVLLYYFGYNLLFFNNIISLVSIVASSMLIAIMNKSIVEHPTVNIWYVGDTFSYLILLIVRRVFFFLLNNRKKR
jgi:hypothetical protein